MENGVIKDYNHAMEWIWQQPEWPDFQYDALALKGCDAEFIATSGRLMGRIEGMTEQSQIDISIDLMLSEAIKTSSIEGEALDRDSVRASLLARISGETSPVPADLKSEGIATLMLDARKERNNLLTHDMLHRWQTMAVPEERGNITLRGHYRTGTMTIASGIAGDHYVHYEAPPAAQVLENMSRFLEWYNQSRTTLSNSGMSGLVRAGIAHLWFEQIHPFDDGNGRVGRSIADHAMSQLLGYPSIACLSTVIDSNKKLYYRELGGNNRRSLSINSWLNYFVGAASEAVDAAKKEVDFVLNKTRFYDSFADQLNARQSKMVARVFAEGRKGFEGGITTRKYEKIAKCPNRTASRDLSDMFEKGAISKLSGSGRSTRYALALIEKSPTPIIK